jgi:2-aminoadipate transaminase
MAAPVYLSQKSQRTEDQPISYFMQQAVENPRLISLAAGLVDAESLPAADIAEAANYLLGDPVRARAALQYGTTPGHAPLRELLVQRAAAADRLKPSDMGLSTANTIVTTGSQQLLYLLSEALLDPGDIVITAAPSYFVYQGTLHSMGVRIYAVPCDADGMNTDALAELLRRLNRSELARLRLIYVVDYFDNPTGATLSRPRRQHLMDLVRRYSRDQRVLVLEDAAYRELRYDGPDLPSIKSLDSDNEQVILAQTFSKPCSPGLKTGYAFVPSELREPLLRLKGNHDFGSNNFTQHLLHRLLETGAFDRHIERLRRVYHRKRDVLLDALGAEFPAATGIRWLTPNGGMYVWLTFPPEVNTGPGGRLMPLALETGVLYVPGQFCYVNDLAGRIPTNAVRLCFGVVHEDGLREGVKRLGQAYRAATRTPIATAQSALVEVG